MSRSILSSVAKTLLVLSFVAIGQGCKTTSSNSRASSGTSANTNRTVAPPPIAAGKGQPITLIVRDARGKDTYDEAKNRELVGRGDKGAVYYPGTYISKIRGEMESQFVRAGFRLVDKAPVVLEVDVRTVAGSARQFTHQHLNSESGSTVDAVRVLLPKETRPTKAQTILSATIRKNGERAGFSYFANKLVENTSKEKSIVKTTIDQSITQATRAIAAQASPDVDLVARIPVTDQEFDTKKADLEIEKQQLTALKRDLREREKQLDGDVRQLQDIRKSLQAERQTLESDLAARKKELVAQEAEIARTRQQLADRVRSLAAREAEIKQANPGLTEAQLAEKLTEVSALQAQVARQQSDLEIRSRETARQAALVDKQRTQIEQQKQQLAANEKELQRRIAELNSLKQGNAKLVSSLASRDQKLVTYERDIAKLRSELEAKRKAPEKKIEVPQAFKKNEPPVIAIFDPQAQETVTTVPRVTVRGMVVDDEAITNVRVLVNGRVVSQGMQMAMAKGSKAIGAMPISEVESASTRGNVLISAESQSFQRFAFDVPLRTRKNVITIEASDQKQTSKQSVTVIYDEPSGTTHVVAVGVNDYRSKSVPALKYAVTDAHRFANAIKDGLSLPDENVTLLLNEDANLANLRDVLGVKLPSRARKDDTVVIFFSGHGAPEKLSDTASEVERYLLPVDANPSSFFSSALPMSEVARIFRRIGSERVVFVVDTCYSGAVEAGGRGLLPTNQSRAIGAMPIDEDLKRSGRVVLTASKGSEVSQELDDLKHGVFTYYLIDGMKGKADGNRDRRVSVSELYKYVKQMVSAKTLNKQNPQMHKEGSSEIVVSVLK